MEVHDRVFVRNNPVNWVDPQGLASSGIVDGIKGGLSTDGPGAIIGGIIGTGVGGALGQATGVPGLQFQGAIAGGILGSEIGRQFDGPSIDPIQAQMDQDTDGDGINDYFDFDDNNDGIPDDIDMQSCH